ncbi:hypothetical protein SAMN05444392_1263 [Seinonella peptonophila]|uniref:Uncharacterized protein n=1 Tax=Seinonella peptonophila TaxID=112248 RepID=A0A1M5BM00_9BACL|nr:hypothetical protein [Seinonella peptonophila]SHF43242.1 hypothetical protein SAMN05444392_1263 [Seinonella peptonophila]
MQTVQPSDKQFQTMNGIGLTIPILSTTFGYISGYTIDQQLGMAGFGLLWGILVMLIASRISQVGARSIRQANTPVYIMLPLACIVLGGAILGHLAGPNPNAFLQLLQQSGYGLFFFTLHSPFEWILMPWALIANWHHPTRRRLLIIAAGIFYLGRVASALYFAPAALYWGQHPAEAVAHIDQVTLWIYLDFIRLIWQDVGIVVLMLIAALHPKFRLVNGDSRPERRHT